MAVRAFALVAVLLALVVDDASALYFKLRQNQQRCFIQDLPADMLVMVEYKAPDTDAELPDNNKIRGTIRSPTNEVVVNEPLDGDGRFAFTSAAIGEHSICFERGQTATLGGVAEARVDVKVNVGEMAIDYTDVAKREHLSTLEIEVRKLNDKMSDVLKEQLYQRERETSFRNTSESTNSRVQWWSIFQTVVLILSGWYQVRVLKEFFKQRRLTSRR